MASKSEANDDESFIILGTSPGSSLDIKYNSMNGHDSLDKAQLDDALKDLSEEANMAFKAHFKLADTPSPASLMVASSIVTDEKSTEELQKRFGELLDENVILKETLKHNNDSMKEQFLLIASCQEDMMKTHLIHKEKFDETRELIEKLRQENKKLKQDILRMEAEHKDNGSSGPPSALEFVTSPEDDTVHKLTAQLELVEKQRRQVIGENNKLTWQKESLEHIVDATSKERDDLKEKIKELELQLSSKDNEYDIQVDKLNNTVEDLNKKLLTASTSQSNTSSEEVSKRDLHIQQLEAKISGLQNDLKTAQLRILDLENVKLEFMKHKSGVSETIKIYKDQIQELNNRIKETQAVVYQPVRLSVSSDSDVSDSSLNTFKTNVKLYDKALVHLADLLNAFSNGATDGLMQTLGVVASLHDFKLDKTTVEQFKNGLNEVKQQLEKQHTAALNNIAQVRSTLTIFEGIFKDYKEVLKKASTKENTQSNAQNLETLTAALVARGDELLALKAELNKMKEAKEDCELLKAQLELYKSDFEAERESREKMACEKENILTDLRTTQRRNQELLLQLDEIRKQTGGARGTRVQMGHNSSGMPAPASGTHAPLTRVAGARPGNTATGNVIYTCPKCGKFSSHQMKVMDDHFDFCLDDF